MSDSIDEKKIAIEAPPSSIEHGYTGDVMDPINNDDAEFEVFAQNADGVNFRTVGWARAAMIFIKSKDTYLRASNMDMRLI